MRILSDFKWGSALLILLAACVYGSLLNNLNLWTDEIYSVLMAKDSLKDMFTLLLTEDSKPPLYYLYLKAMLFLFPERYEIFGAHFASYILLFVAALFAITAIRKDYGTKVAFAFLLQLFLMPHSLWLAFEARTYMLSALLLLMALVYGLRLTRNFQKNDCIKFIIVTVLALYSHYYCALWLMFLYVFILLKLYKNNQLKEYAFPFFMTVLIPALLFLPWLYVPLKTATGISKYWYVNNEFVIFSFQFFTNPLQPEIIQSIFFIATTLQVSSATFILFIGIFTAKSWETPKKRLFYYALFSFVLTYALLLLLSYLIRPMVTARYLKIFSLVLYLAAAVVLAESENIKKAFVLLSVPCFFLNYIDIRYISFDEGYKKTAQDIRQFISPNDTILTFDNANLWCEYYLKDYTCLQIADENGEVLRMPQLKKNRRLYYKEPSDKTFALSIYTIPTPTYECMKYNSIYRYGANLNLCWLTKDATKQFLDKTIKNRLK